MKKIIFLLPVIILLSACGGNNNKISNGNSTGVSIKDKAIENNKTIKNVKIISGNIDEKSIPADEKEVIKVIDDILGD